MYPRDLEIKLESENIHEVAYLDLKLSTENTNLIVSLYDKRDSFSFDIVNYPHIDSCIPKRSALGVFVSQLIRYARICTKFVDFRLKAVSLINKLKNQGYCDRDLKRLSLKFFRERRELIDKYNIQNGNIFTEELF
jgi:hypothetical protein